MNDASRATAERMRLGLARHEVAPSDFRSALLEVAPSERDAWVDAVLGLGELPEDGEALPRGCAPYLPCSVDALLRVVDHAPIAATDVFVDVGAGLGRATTLVHLLTGAGAIGLEIQPALVDASRDLTARLNVPRVAVVACDAVEHPAYIAIGTVFFLYCPFSGERLERLLEDLAGLARTRPIRICCVDLLLPPRPWLTRRPLPFGDLSIYESTGIAR